MKELYSQQITPWVYNYELPRNSGKTSTLKYFAMVDPNNIVIVNSKLEWNSHNAVTLEQYTKLDSINFEKYTTILVDEYRSSKLWQHLEQVCTGKNKIIALGSQL